MYLTTNSKSTTQHRLELVDLVKKVGGPPKVAHRLMLLSIKPLDLNYVLNQDIFGWSGYTRPQLVC